MPTTRKKVIKTIYKDEDDSEEPEAYSDSGSEAEIPDEATSDEEDLEDSKLATSEDEFEVKIKKPSFKPIQRRPKFAKAFINKVNRSVSYTAETESELVPISVKDLTDADKLLPPVLNLSESDSSDDEAPAKKKPPQNKLLTNKYLPMTNSDSESEQVTEYRDVWSKNIVDNSLEIAQKTFLELEEHKNKIDQVKASVENYTVKPEVHDESNVTDLLALGEEAQTLPTTSKKDNKKKKVKKDNSESELEDWEEVEESKAIPEKGLQLLVDFPDAVCRKKKTLDVEMMMKRKINRVKKEYQVYMHKVHVLCWLGHGNYVSRTLNDQEILAAALSLVPSKECYPGERVDVKYVEQITKWYKDKLTFKQDKNENKFKPKAPPLKTILLSQIKSKIVTTKKNLVFIFVSMLRALGVQCRVMFNFVTLPIKPPSSELCSLSTKAKAESQSKSAEKKVGDNKKSEIKPNNKKKSKEKIPQIDGNFDSSSDSDMEEIVQLDGNDDISIKNKRSTRASVKKAILDEDVSPPKRMKKNNRLNAETANKTVSKEPLLKKGKRKLVENVKDDASPPKISRKSPLPKNAKSNKTESVKRTKNQSKVDCETEENGIDINPDNKPRTHKVSVSQNVGEPKEDFENVIKDTTSKTKDTKVKSSNSIQNVKKPIAKNSKCNSDVIVKESSVNPRKTRSNINPKIVVTNGNNVSSEFFSPEKQVKPGKLSLRRPRSQSATPDASIDVIQTETKSGINPTNAKTRTRSAPMKTDGKSKYFNDENTNKIRKLSKVKKQEDTNEDKMRVSHRDLNKSPRKGDVTKDLISIIKNRVTEAKSQARLKLVKGKNTQESDEDSEYLPEEDVKAVKSESDDDFKPVKISPKPRPSTSRKIDRRVLSSSEEDGSLRNKTDVWCEVYVEELEQWVAVDVIKVQVHCTNEIYNRATHPVGYVVGWDNNNYLKDLTRRYVPHWNTVTRKQRVEPQWWIRGIKPWLGPKTAKDREEDEALDRMQLEAPLPTTISEYKNHPLYALKRHLLKFEAIYPPDAATLGFVRGESVYSRDCIYTCRSRDTWLKEAKVVRLGEKPYKIVKARPKWDRLSNKLITDKPLEVFGPWQVQEYEPPTAENGIVPRNPYGNVELFKECMLPKGTVHIKLPGLNRVAKKLNIDCAPAMTGFDFNGGWTHPVYDGFVVCKEFEEVITEAWLKDQEEQEKREQEKLEARVYGNWKKLIKGLLIKQRLKLKYGFEEPSTSNDKKKGKGPRLIVKKKP